MSQPAVPAPTPPLEKGNYRRWWRHLLPLPLYLLLTIAFTWPLATHFGDHVILAGGSDAWAHLWNLWWTRHAVINGQSPFFTDYLYYPTGVSLRFHALNQLGGLLSIPLQPIFGLTASFNLLVIFNLTVAAWGAYLLANYVFTSTTSPNSEIVINHVPTVAAFVAGVVYAYAPAAASFVRLGQLELTSIHWLPFAALLLLGAMRPPYRWWDALLAALFTFLASQHTWYYGMFALIFAGLLFLWQIVRPEHPHPTSPARGEEMNSTPATGEENDSPPREGVAGGRRPADSPPRKGVAGGGRTRLRLLRQIAIVVGGFGLAALPLLLPMARELAGSRPVLADENFIVYNAAALPDFFQPGPSLLWGNAAAGVTEVSWFVGLTAGLLAIIGVVAGVRAGGLLPRYTLFFSFATLISFLLALGPYLKLTAGGLPDNDSADPNALFEPFGPGSSLPLPYYLFRYTPLGSIARVAGRFSLLAMLGLAVLAAIGAAAITTFLQSRLPREQRVINHASTKSLSSFLFPLFSTLILATLIFAESLPSGGQPLSSTASPAIYQQLRQDAPGSYGVMELPNNCAPQYELYQTAHQQKVLGGYVSRKYDYPFAADTPTIRQLFVDGQLPAEGDIISRELTRTAATILNYYNIRYVAVHLDCFSTIPRRSDAQREAEKNQLLNLLNTMFNGQAPEVATSDIILYRVPAAAAIPPLAVELAGGGWLKFQDDKVAGTRSRWATNWNGTSSSREVGLTIWSPVTTTAQLSTTIYAYFGGNGPEDESKIRDVQIRLNGAPLQAIGAKVAQQPLQLTLNLRPGTNQLTFYSPEPGYFDVRNDDYLSFGFLKIDITTSP